MKIVAGSDVRLSVQEIQEADVFKGWAHRLGSQWRGEVVVNAVDIWGYPPQIHMMQMMVAREGSPWPIRVILRSETVDVLTIVTDGRQKWVVFTEQDRDAVGIRVFSNVAGGRGWNESVYRAADRELWEELGLGDVEIDFGVDISMLLPHPVLASPGITNERAYMMCAIIHVAPDDIEPFIQELQNKKTGETAEGEDITLTVKPADEARNFIKAQSNPDAKTLLSLAEASL